ncbi:unnamed protein product [Adineta ricciae]|uniref:Uncharacterized protein n=1 Tax=Adineta ricciae TaxID=249248 RepID=A0A815APQ8_ADIRI|nr:unnamed protein product [Adineta ricciae]
MNNDNLSDFLNKLTRFGVDQCLHLTHLISNKQKPSIVLNNPSTQITKLLIEIETLQNEYYDILSRISTSDEQGQQRLFEKLQTSLSTFVQINLRLKSLNSSSKEKHEKSISNVPDVSPSVCSNVDLNNITDIGKCWKFANIIHTRFQISLIASNSHVILCYNNQKHVLHAILLAGQFQGDIRWKYGPIVDLLWCAPIDRYIALTRQSIYSIEYNRSSRTNPILTNRIFDLKNFQSVRIACNDCNILLYFTESQQSSIEIYDYEFNQENVFTSLTNQQLPINSPSFCCTNTLIALTEKENMLISCFPYVTPKKTSLLLFDIATLNLCHTIDLNDCLNIYTMKCLTYPNIFFALSDEKILWIVSLDQNDTVQIAKKIFYTNQTELCVINQQDLLLINVNVGCSIQMIKYRKVQQ